MRCDQLKAEVTTFQSKLHAFREETPNTQQRVAEIDSTIAKFKVEIQSLELQRASVLEKEALIKKGGQHYYTKG